MTTVIDGDFEWDDEKARTNLQKHGVSFDEAASTFADSQALFIDDGDGRLVIIGYSNRSRVLTVVHVERGERDRLISARRATGSEYELYVSEAG